MMVVLVDTVVSLKCASKHSTRPPFYKFVFTISIIFIIFDNYNMFGLFVIIL